MKAFKSYISGCIILSMMIFSVILIPIRVKAEGTAMLPVTAEYEQSSARAMINNINSARTGADAWYWNEDNTEKIICNNLSPMVYDYDLEEAAMLRALEISLIFDHTRPNGKSPFSTYSWRSAGENIAAGYTNANSVFTAWMEEDEMYDGQGHRRNILSNRTTAVAVGHVIRDGVHYWVQEFRSPVGSQVETPVPNGTRTTNVEILKDKFSSTLKIDGRSSIYVGDTIDLNNLYESVSYKNGSFFDSGIRVPVTSGYGITDDSPATLEDNVITATGVGEITITATSSITGEELTCKVNVTKKNITNSVLVNVDSWDFVYTGEEIKPSITVIFNDYEMVEGEDYNLQYSNNVNSGTALMEITGIGNFEGTCTRRFTISPKRLTEDMVTISEREFVYDGTAKKPVVTVTDGDKVLQEDTDYTTYYGNNTYVGTGYVNVKGIGNYVGNFRMEFVISSSSNGSGSASGGSSDYDTSSGDSSDYDTSSGGNDSGNRGSSGSESRPGSVTDINNLRPSATSIKKLQKGKKKITVKWNYVADADGYELEYSTDRYLFPCKTKKVSGTYKSSVTLKKLKSNKKYYVRIRSYKYSGGRKIYSDWSKTKKAKTK